MCVTYRENVGASRTINCKTGLGMVERGIQYTRNHIANTHSGHVTWSKGIQHPGVLTNGALPLDLNSCTSSQRAPCTSCSTPLRIAPLRGQSGGPENVPPTLGSLRQYIPVQVPWLRERRFDEYNDRWGGRGGRGLPYCFMTKDLMVLAAADMIERFMYVC